jgi:phosphatidylserine/phosphatidylglycerophosphate/cardiolipin synthase-like enzyme
MKRLPEGLAFASAPIPVDPAAVEFLADVTWERDGRRGTEQQIFDRLIGMIRGAEQFVAVDLFLFNGYLGQESSAHRALSREVADALLQRKRERPGLAVVVISDPLNEAYGGARLPLFEEMRAAGIPVVLTDLAQLRYSNPAYSVFWRIGVQWLGVSEGGSLPHPLAASAPRVGLRAWLALMNFRANHRKTAIADVPAPGGGRTFAALVTSANPHDGSSAHGNVALLVRDDAVARALWESERAVIRFSAPDSDPGPLPETDSPRAQDADDPHIRILTENRIREAVIDALGAAGSGDAVDLGMFYLSDRGVVDAIAGAADRGAIVRLLLDPNRDAFGYRKNGVPNRPAATELVRRGAGRISVRWYETHGEQFHSKLLLVRRQAGSSSLLLGSANYTRRNLQAYNLETCLLLEGPASLPALAASADYFERLWSNRDQAYSVPHERYADDAMTRRLQYRFQEATGMGTF